MHILFSVLCVLYSKIQQKCQFEKMAESATYPYLMNGWTYGAGWVFHTSLNSREMAQCDICEDNIAASAKMVEKAKCTFCLACRIY